MGMDPTVPVDRLRRSADITAVLRGRRQRAGRLAVVYARRTPAPRPARVAVLASRKVGTAVARNRAKRLLREAARRVPWQAGVDVVLVARSTCASSRAQAVTAEVTDLAEQLGLVAGDGRRMAS